MQYVDGKNFFARLLTLTGILLGLVLSLLAVWGDYEATSYGFMRRAQAPFHGLRCPIFIGKNERQFVSVRVSNPTDRTLSPGVWTEISTSQEAISKIDYIQLAPGDQRTLQQTIGPENIDLGFFIFVDVLVYSSYPLPDRESTCGILVLPVSGAAVIPILGMIASSVCMAAGMWILYKRELPGRRPRSMLFMGIATLLAMTLAFLGWWFQALILVILVILTLAITSGASSKR